MEIENELFLDSDLKFENNFISILSDLKFDNCVVDQESFFFLLQNFCDVVDMIIDMNGQGICVIIFFLFK